MPPFCLSFVSCLVASCENIFPGLFLMPDMQQCNGLIPCWAVSHPALKWRWLFPHRQGKSWISKEPGETTVPWHFCLHLPALYMQYPQSWLFFRRSSGIQGVEATLFLQSNCFHRSSKQVRHLLNGPEEEQIWLSSWALWKHHQVPVQSLLVPPRPAACQHIWVSGISSHQDTRVIPGVSAWAQIRMET